MGKINILETTDSRIDTSPSFRYSNLRFHLIAVILTLLGLLCRLPYLKLGLWRDEGSTYFNIIPTTFEDILARISYTELNPPAFYIVLKQWILAIGMDDILFKLPSLIFGLLLIPAMYFLGQSIGSRKAGIISAFIATFHYEAIYYSQEARPYTLSMLLCCLTLIAYISIIDNNRNALKNILFLSLSCSLFFYVQYTGFILVIALGMTTIILSLFKKVEKQTAWLTLSSFLLALLLFIPWINNFIVHFRTGLPWQEKANFLARIIGVPYNIFRYTTTYLTTHTLFQFLCVFVIFVFTLKEVFNSLKYLQIDDPAQDTLQKRKFTIFTIFVLVISALTILDYRDKYILPFCPIAWCIYGLWLDNLFEQIRAHTQTSKKLYTALSLTACVMMITICFSSLANVAKLSNTPKSGIASMAQEMNEEELSSSFFILVPDFLSPTFGYYFQDTPATFRGFGRWKSPEIFSPRQYAEIWNSDMLLENFLSNLQLEANENFDYIYLIKLDQQLYNQGKMKYSKVNDVLRELQQRYKLIDSTTYKGLEESVIAYKFAN